VSSAWSESTITWNDAPALGPTIATIGTAPLGAWIEVDVTSAVTGNGSYSFGASSTSTSSLRMSSKEGIDPPQLVITTAG
jgi:hypothetical protein